MLGQVRLRADSFPRVQQSVMIQGQLQELDLAHTQVAGDLAAVAPLRQLRQR